MGYDVPYVCTILYKYGKFVQYLQNKVGKIYPHFGVF